MSRERRCVATGEVRDEADLIRMALGPGNQLVPDLAAKLVNRSTCGTQTISGLLTLRRNGELIDAKDALVISMNRCKDQQVVQSLT